MDLLVGTFASRPLLIVRVFLGVVFFAHGSQKVFGWFGGGGLRGTIAYFKQALGVPPPLTVLAALTELLGGLAMIVGLLVNPTNPAARALSGGLEAAARNLGLQLDVLHASTERDIDDAFATLVQRRASALVIVADAFFNSRSEQLGALTLRHALPTIFQYPEFVDAGGLMSYSGSNADSYRWAGNYSGRILKGEKPADLPVQQSTKVELIINLKTARTLGLKVPPTLLARADEVIE